MIERIRVDRVYRYKYKGELLTANELAALPHCTVGANCVRTRLSYYFSQEDRVFSTLDEIVSIKRRPGGWGKPGQVSLKAVPVKLNILDEWLQQSPPPRSLCEI